MGKLSTALVDSMLDQVFGAVTYTPPATVYVALSTTLPTDTGTNVTEPAGGGYARVAVTNNTTNWPAASARSKANGTVITFPTASGSWGTITHFCLYDAATAGNFLGWGALTVGQAINSGATPDFPVGSLTITAPGS